METKIHDQLYINGQWAKPAGTGTIIWDARRRLAAGEIDIEKFTELLCGSAPSTGQCARGDDG